MNVPRIPMKPVLAGVAACGLLALVVRTATSGPPTVPREKDRARAERELPPPRGGDERTPLAPGGDWIAGNGVVEPADREIAVAGEVAGRVAAIEAAEGQWVEAGAALVHLEAGVERAALAAAEAELEPARAELRRTARGLRREDVDAAIAEAGAARSRAELSWGALQRTEALAAGGAATPDELDRARRQASIDRMTAEAAEARRRAAEAGSRAEDVAIAEARASAASARREQAAAALARLSIRAPAAGEVLEIKVRPGESWSPTSASPVAILGDTRRLRVRVDVDERDIGRLRPGAAAYATAPAFPGERFPGKVVEIGRRMGRKNVRTDDPAARIDTKILEVVFELEAKASLVPGLRVLGWVQAGPARAGS
jgi:HlyD family secretion protein